MAAVFAGSLSSPASFLKRPRLVLSQRRLAANRRNAARSTGPRTVKGKARVARNAIKHGFFADAARWTAQQHRDFAETFIGLCDDFKPQTEREQLCVAIVADSFVRMAAVWRYENIAALKHHREVERAMDDRIAGAEPSEAARLEAHRGELRRAGLWRPTIPGPREAAAIVRYEGRLHRAIRDATAELHGLRAMRKAASPQRKMEKQTHFVDQRQAVSENTPRRFARADAPISDRNGGHSRIVVNGVSDSSKNGKTNPLNAEFTGNRHQRRRAAALAHRYR